MREIDSVGIIITTKCTKVCPDCCIDNIHMDKYDVSMEYLKKSALYLKGLRRIQLTGGEPTLHPNFEEIVRGAKDLFECEFLTLETNGNAENVSTEVLNLFDMIYISHYTPLTYSGCEDNIAQIGAILEKVSRDKVTIGEVKHIVVESKGYRQCSRIENDFVVYHKGRIYPCCVVPSITSLGLPISSTWKTDILTHKPDCLLCKFNGEDR